MTPTGRGGLGSGALIVLVLLGAAAGARGGAAGDDIGTVAGSFTFKTYCAVCHGTEGKGDGPLADNLRFHPPDLTLITKRNGGTFPDETVHKIIDGRKPIKGHGGPDMPVWGDAFKNSESGFSDEKVRERIQGLVDHLKSLQASAK
jgi:mono/diheme cytochrome c family protein